MGISSTAGPRAAGQRPEGYRPLGFWDLAHLDFVEQVFLPAARAKRLLTPDEEERLALLTRHLMVEAGREVSHLPSPRAGDLPPPAGRPYAVTAGAPAPATAPPVAPQAPSLPAARPVEPRPPSALRLWWDRTVQTVGSDLAVHGIAYLGVLLFFVGAFGLVAFAFGDVAPALRPLAEVVIAVAPFAAGALLRRRRAQVVGRALEVAGGLVLPIMVVTSFLDGVGVPPDLTGTPLVVVLTGVVTALAVAYALWSRHAPDSALRYLVAPLLWLAVGLASMGVGREIPEGRAVAVPSVWQAALMTAALAVSVAAARLRPTSRWSDAVLVAATPGLVVLAVLNGLTWTAGDAPAAPVLVAGVAVLVATEGLALRLPRLVVVAQPLWWTLVWAVLVAGILGDLAATAWVSAVVALGFVGILELAEAEGRAAPARLLPALGLASALLATWVDARWSLAAFGIATVGAAWRRGHPYAAPRAPLTCDVVAALLPVGAVASAVVVWDATSALLVAGGFLLLIAVPAGRGWLDRRPGDRYWRVWFGAATAFVSVLVLAVWSDASAAVGAAAWQLAGAAALVATAAAVAPSGRTARPSAVVVPATLAWLALSRALELPSLLQLSVPALAGLALVVLAHTSSPRAARLDAAIRLGIGLAGLLLGAVVVLLSVPTTWGVVVATAAATVAWGTTGWFDALGRSVVGAVLRRVAPLLGWLPLVLAAVGVPVVALLTADRAGWLPAWAPWSATVVAAVALAYAALTRLQVPARVGATASAAAFALAVVASVPGRERVPVVVDLAALAATVLVLAPERRSPVMVWVAWLVPAPAAFVLAQEVSGWFVAQSLGLQGAMALVAVGSVLLVGGVATDLRGRAWEPTLLPVHDALVAPTAVGALEVAGGVVLAAVVDLGAHSTVSGWVSGIAALVIAATAVLTRVGASAGVAVVVGWLSALQLARTAIETRPWIGALAAGALLAAAQALAWRSPTPRSGAWWTRWDTPLLTAAAPVAATAVVSSLTSTGAAADITLVAVGAECGLVATRMRRTAVLPQVLAALGVALVLLGTGRAGPGWLALALLALSVALTFLAARANRPARYGFRAAGIISMALAWSSALMWSTWPAQRAVDVSALVAAGIAAIAAAVVTSRRLGREWGLVWGSAAALVEMAAAAVALLPQSAADVTPGWTLVGGLLVVAAALLVSSSALGALWQREVGTAYVLGAVAAAPEAAALTSAGRVWVLSAVGTACAVVALAMSDTRHAPMWRASLLLLGWATTAGAVATAVGGPVPAMLAPALAVAALEAAATGVCLRLLWPQLLSPAFACTAWIVFALETLDGNPQWVVAPIGLATIVAVALWRRDRLRRGADAAAREVVYVELVGVALLVGPSLTQAVTTGVIQAVMSAAVGCVVAGWGAVTRVRRRLAAGIVIVLVSVLVLVGVPLVSLVPTWGGAALWLLIAVLGLVAVLVAALLERGKAAVRTAMVRFTEATEGWE